MRRVLACVLLCAAGVRAEEPTPFWMSPPPPPPEKKEPAKPKKKPERLEPLEIKEEPSAPPPQKPVEPPVQPTWLEPPAPPPARTAAPARPAPASLRRWSFAATIGTWGRPSSDDSGRTWDLAWGLRISFAPSPNLDLDLVLARASGAAGSPFVNASLAHDLAILRAFWVLGERYALLLGGGAGIALAQTHYSLLPSTDPGVVASGLDALALRPVIAVTAAARARFFGGLEARAEVSAVARDGRLELLPLLGLGAAF